jgi:hypothetical protein
LGKLLPELFIAVDSLDLLGKVMGRPGEESLLLIVQVQTLGGGRCRDNREAAL